MTESNLGTVLITLMPPASTKSQADQRDDYSSFGKHLAEAGRDRHDTASVAEPKADDLRAREAKDATSREDNHTADSLGDERDDQVNANEELVQVDDTTESENNQTTDDANAEHKGVIVAANEVVVAEPEDSVVRKVKIDVEEETQAEFVRTERVSLKTGHTPTAQEQSDSLPTSISEQPVVETKDQTQSDKTPAAGEDGASDRERQEQTIVDGKAGNTERVPKIMPNGGDAKQKTTATEDSRAVRSVVKQYEVEHDTTARPSPDAEQASFAGSDANIQGMQEKQEIRSTPKRQGRRGEMLSPAVTNGHAEQVGVASNGAVPGVQEIASLLETHGKETASEPNVLGNDQGDLRSSTPASVSRPLDFTSPNAVRSDAGTSTKQPRIDPERFVARVAKAFQLAEDRGGQLRLRLSPPELGSIRLELAVKNGAVTATIETETAAARHALLDNLPALRDRLTEQNMRVEQFDVHVRDEGANGKQEHAMDNQGERYSPGSGNEQSNTQGQSDSASTRAGRQSAISRGDETLNVMV